MKGIHINWSKPSIKGKSKESYDMDYFEILVNILSALKWRKYNGSIKLYADKITANYYRKLGLDSIYDGGIDDSLDEYIPKTIDASMYWAGAKIYAVSKEKAPFVMIDLDFIVWKDISEILKSQELCVSHKEFLNSEVYPNKDELYTSLKYKIDPEWDWSQLPCNTALVYFKNDDFKSYYVNESIKFMEQNSDIPPEYKTPMTHMLFAEQRILTMCAKKKNIRPYCFISNCDPTKKDDYTHIWGVKNKIRDNVEKRNEMCKNCIKYIREDYPEMIDKLIDLRTV